MVKEWLKIATNDISIQEFHNISHYISHTSRNTLQYILFLNTQISGAKSPSALPLMTTLQRQFIRPAFFLESTKLMSCYRIWLADIQQRGCMFFVYLLMIKTVYISRILFPSIFMCKMKLLMLEIRPMSSSLSNDSTAKM